MPQPNAKSPQESNRLLDESMQRAYSKVSGEMPDVKHVSVSPRSASPLTSWMMPRGSMAVTNPFTGNITYDPAMFQGQDSNEQEQMLAHELTHVRQTQNTPWYKIVGGMFQRDAKVPEGVGASSPLNSSYQWRPNEMEAFQTERDRADKNKIPNYVDPVLGSRDIMLPSAPKKSGIDTGPSPKANNPLIKDVLGSALAKSKEGMKLSTEEQTAMSSYLDKYHKSPYAQSLKKTK